MTTLKQIYQQFFRTGLLVAIIIPTILLSQDPPEEFQFSISTLQGFYFSTDVTLNGAPIESDDWVAAFKGDICVGARLWNTSECGGGICDVPTMGDDGSEYTTGYMQIGDVPTFKIYDASSGNIFDAIPSEEVDGWSNMLFSFNDLLEANGDILGCMEIAACNYDSDATVDDGLCEEFDCAGECGGDAEDLGCGCGEDAPSGCDNNCGSILENDECGVCDGDNSTCTGCTDDIACNYNPSATISGDCEYAVENYDCSGNCNVIVDCDGVCDGSAEVDDCGECVEPDDDTCPLDCAGVEGGSAELDECGCCNGGGIPSGKCGCESECGANDWLIVDDCGLCDGDSICLGDMIGPQCVSGEFNVGEFNVSGFDCAGECFSSFNYGSDECYDCADTPYGEAELDDCGICSGGYSEHIENSDQDCTGECFGNSVLDECGICFGENDDMNEFGLSCQFGCTDENATNYYCNVYVCENGELPEGFLDDSTCTYIVEGTVIYFAPTQLFPQSFIQDVIVTLFAQTVGVYGQPNGEININTTFTDSVGGFRFLDVPSNYIDYYFEFSYTEIANDNNIGISVNDAQLISEVVIAESSFEAFNNPSHSYIAADVNLDGRINSYDSSLIGRYLSALEENDISFSMNELNIRWKFVSGMDTITSLTDNESVIIYGIKLGDPNGSWE